MKIQGDERLWFDKADGKTVYGVFEDQRFYSSLFEPSYEGEAQDVRDLIRVIETFSSWAQLNYHGLRAGTGQVPLPDELRGVKLYQPDPVPVLETRGCAPEPEVDQSAVHISQQAEVDSAAQAHPDAPEG